MLTTWDANKPYGNKPYQLLLDFRHSITIWKNQKTSLYLTSPAAFRKITVAPKNISPKNFGK